MHPIKWHHDDEDIANGGWDKPLLVLDGSDKYDNVIPIKDNRDVPYDNDAPFADWLSEKQVNDTVPF